MDSQYALYVTKSLVTEDIKLLGAKKTTYFKVLKLVDQGVTSHPKVISRMENVKNIGLTPVMII